MHRIVVLYYNIRPRIMSRNDKLEKENIICMGVNKNGYYGLYITITKSQTQNKFGHNKREMKI